MQHCCSRERTKISMEVMNIVVDAIFVTLSTSYVSIELWYVPQGLKWLYSISMIYTSCPEVLHNFFIIIGEDVSTTTSNFNIQKK